MYLIPPFLTELDGACAAQPHTAMASMSDELYVDEQIYPKMHEKLFYMFNDNGEVLSYGARTSRCRCRNGSRTTI